MRTVLLALVIGALVAAGAGASTPGRAGAGVPARVATTWVDATQISAGGTNTCAVLEGGRLRCWGWGLHGANGHDNTANVGDRPRRSILRAGDVPVGGRVVQVAAGGHTCAILARGTLRCWGWGSYGALGYGSRHAVGDRPDRSIKKTGDVPLGGTPVQVEVGIDHTCALLARGAVRCWGWNGHGQLGHGNRTNIGDSPRHSIRKAGDVPIGGKATAIALGYDHSCALLTTGAVRCWGKNVFGQLGHDSTEPVGDGIGPSIIAAGDVPLGGDAVAIAAGDQTTCALLDTGAVRCWGQNTVGNLGQDSTDHVGDGHGPSIIEAGDIDLPEDALAVGVGGWHTCVLLVSGAVRCFGWNGFGSLGYGGTVWVGTGEPDAIAVADAPAVPIGRKADAITVSGATTCALLHTGGARCWGGGLDGRHGYNGEFDIGGPGDPSIIDMGDLRLARSP